MKGYRFYYHRNNTPAETYVKSKLISIILLRYFNCKFKEIYTISENDCYFNEIAKIEKIKYLSGYYELDNINHSIKYRVNEIRDT